MVGELGNTVPSEVRDSLLDHPGVHHADMADVSALQPLGPQVEASVPLGVNIAARADGSAAVHLVNFAYDRLSDEVAALHDVEISVRLPFDAVTATQVSSDGGTADLELSVTDGRHTFTLPTARLYEVVTLARSRDARGVDAAS